MNEEAKPPQPENKNKLPTSAYILCGWPLVLVFVGGALGGGLGGAAFAINLEIYKSKLPLAVKVILNILTGLAAVILWLVIGSWIHAKFSSQ